MKKKNYINYNITIVILLTSLKCDYIAAFRSPEISSYYKIFMSIYAREECRNISDVMWCVISFLSFILKHSSSIFSFFIIFTIHFVDKAPLYNSVCLSFHSPRKEKRRRRKRKRKKRAVKSQINQRMKRKRRLMHLRDYCRMHIAKIVIDYELVNFLSIRSYQRQYTFIFTGVVKNIPLMTSGWRRCYLYTTHTFYITFQYIIMLEQTLVIVFFFFYETINLL